MHDSSEVTLSDSVHLQGLSRSGTKSRVSIGICQPIQSEVEVWRAVAEWELSSEHESVRLLRHASLLPFSEALLIRAVVFQELHHQVWNVLILITVEMFNQFTSQEVRVNLELLDLRVLVLKITIHVSIEKGLSVRDVILLFGNCIHNNS